MLKKYFDSCCVWLKSNSVPLTVLILQWLCKILHVLLYLTGFRSIFWLITKHWFYNTVLKQKKRATVISTISQWKSWIIEKNAGVPHRGTFAKILEEVSGLWGRPKPVTHDKNNMQQACYKWINCPLCRATLMNNMQCRIYKFPRKEWCSLRLTLVNS